MADKLVLHEINNDKIALHVKGNHNDLENYKNIFESLSVATYLDHISTYSESDPVSFEDSDDSYAESGEEVLILTFENTKLAEKKINEMFDVLSKKPTLKEGYIKALQATWNEQLLPYHINCYLKNTLQTMQFTLIEAFYRANTDSTLKDSILPLLPFIANFTYGKENVDNYNSFPSCRFFKIIKNKINDTKKEHTKTCIIL